MLNEMKELCFNFQEILDDTNPETLTQLILDPTSFNLKKRVSTSDPILMEIFKLSRDICNHVHLKRMKMLNKLRK